MNKNVILSCTVTSAGETNEKSQHVPVTPKEIKDSVMAG